MDSGDLNETLKNHLMLLAEKIARHLVNLGPDHSAVFATTFDHKVARDPISFLSPTISGGDLLRKADLAKTLLEGTPTDTHVALEADPWRFDKPAVLAWRAWAQSRLERHVPQDAIAHPSTWTRRSTPSNWSCEEHALAAARECCAQLAALRP